MMLDVIDRLRAALGENEVLTGSEISDRYMGDWHVRAPDDAKPLALVRPRDAAETSQVLRICNESQTPVVPQGGMTGLVGGAVPINGAVLVSVERMRTIEELDTIADTMTVGAGVPLQAIQEAADAAGLIFPLDIGSRGSCVIGGNVSTNAGGNRVLRYGMTRDLVLGLEAVLADGTIITSLNKMLKNNVGYDLKQLFIGSEGTLGIVTRVVLRLFPKPRSTATALCSFDEFSAVYAFLKRAKAALAVTLSSFEVMWPDFFEAALAHGAHRRPLAQGKAGYVLIESMGTDPDLDQVQFEKVIMDAIEAGEATDAVVAQSLAEAERLWAIRDMSGELTHALAPLVAFDVSIETGRIQDFLEDMRARCRARWAEVQIHCFGHLADSNVHMFVSAPERPFPEYEIEEIVYACTRDWHGAISAEIGIGLSKKTFLDWSRSADEIALMRRLKAALDPNRILNPTKVFDQDINPRQEQAA